MSSMYEKNKQGKMQLWLARTLKSHTLNHKLTHFARLTLKKAKKTKKSNLSALPPFFFLKKKIVLLEIFVTFLASNFVLLVTISSTQWTIPYYFSNWFASCSKMILFQFFLILNKVVLSFKKINKSKTIQSRQSTYKLT